MHRLVYGLGMCFAVMLITACATMQSRYIMLTEQKYPPRPEGHEIAVFRTGSPDRPFIRISRLDVHLEKTHFIGSSFEDALPELKKQARLSGADAIIDIQSVLRRWAKRKSIMSLQWPSGIRNHRIIFNFYH